MNPAAYLEMAETESRHWWFLGRRAILSRVMERLDLPRNSRILEVGCGTGHWLARLAAHLAGGLDFGAREPRRELLHEGVVARAVLGEEAQIADRARPPRQPGDVVGEVVDRAQRQLAWKEVAQRVVAKEGSKIYGVISVLVQAFFKAEYLFEVKLVAVTSAPGT